MQHLSALLDAVEQAISRGEIDAAAQYFEEFHHELGKAVEEAVEFSVKSPWTEWRDDEMRETEEEFDRLKVRARELSARFPRVGESQRRRKP